MAEQRRAFRVSFVDNTATTSRTGNCPGQGFYANGGAIYADSPHMTIRITNNTDDSAALYIYNISAQLGDFVRCPSAATELYQYLSAWC